jgi:hypothetical protein
MASSFKTFFISDPRKINMGPPKNEWDGSWKKEIRFYRKCYRFLFISKKMSKIRFLTVTNETLKNGVERMLLDIRKNKFQCEVDLFFSSC